MKKRLFLFVALIMAICAIFAISASARTYTEGSDVYVVTLEGKTIKVTTYNDFPGKTNLTYRADDIVVFDDDFACPSIYIFKDSTEISNGSYGNAGLKKALDFSFLESHGKSYTIDDIIELDIPQGIVTIGTQVGHSLTALKKITFPSSVTSIGGTGFQNASNLEECVFEHSETDGLTTLTGWMFSGCSSLKAISFPDCLTTITGEGNFFQSCNNLGPVYLSKKLQILEKTGSNRKAVFQDLSKVYFVSKPFTTSDTAEAKPDVYYFPESLTTIAPNTFESATGINKVVVFGKNFTSASGSYFFKNVACTVVFLGDMTDINTTNWGNVKIIFANPADMSVSDVTFTPSTPNKTISFCASETDLSKHLASPKHSSIEAATCYSNQKGVVRCFCNIKISEGEVAGTMLTTHNYVDDFDCTTANYCENYGEGKCDKFLVADASEHVETHDVDFANGFTSAGVHNTYCSNATCKALTVIEDLDAMFTHEGYSFKAGTLGGIDTKFKINTKAVILYEQYEGTIHFGIIIANASHFENVDVFIENGTLTSTNAQGDKSGIMVEMTSRDYDYFNCYLDGFDFNNEKHTALGLIIAGYVYGEDESDIAFIQKQYTTDSDDNTLETPYTATVTKGETVSVVNILAVRDFVPIISNDDE